ncbi:MAG: GNAT family N-acetyltransferase [Planctomycetota bacterium]
MATYTLADLDQRSDLAPNVLALFASCAQGANHVVCGLPQRMGLEPTAADLKATLGVLLAMSGRRIAGALAICPYSEDQVTLWGPVIPDAREQPYVMPVLMGELHRALREGGFTSIRALVDTRNRTLRAWMMAAGFNPWKDDHCYECELAPFRAADLHGVQVAARDDLEEVARILAECFPDSDHHRPNLVQRENEGYRHYLLRIEGRAVGAAAVQGGGQRAWLKLIGVPKTERGKHWSSELLAGVLASEARLGHHAIGLEVLEDNQVATAAYHKSNFIRKWTASLLIAPV